MEEIAELLTEPSIGRSLALAIERALAAGAPDNVTVLLAEVVEPPVNSGPGLTWDSVAYRWDSGRGSSH